MFRAEIRLHRKLMSKDNYSAADVSSRYLYGLMFEDISHSGDGGIYGELLINRAFHGMTLPTSQPVAFGSWQLYMATWTNT